MLTSKVNMCHKTHRRKKCFENILYSLKAVALYFNPYHNFNVFLYNSFDMENIQTDAYFNPYHNFNIFLYNSFDMENIQTHAYIKQKLSGSSCSKLTTLLVKVSLKF